MQFRRLAFLTILGGALPLCGPALADPTIGVGVSYSFGGGNGGVGGPGLGLRVFSDNRRDRAAASIGLDYMFQSGRVRPTVGAAYLGDDVYFGADLGYDFSSGGIDFGISGGGTSTEGRKAPAAAAGGGSDGGVGGGGSDGGVGGGGSDGGVGGVGDDGGVGGDVVWVGDGGAETEGAE